MGKTDRSTRDKQRAANLKANKVERSTGRCAICYKEVSVDSAKGTRFTHRCYTSAD